LIRALGTLLTAFVLANLCLGAFGTEIGPFPVGVYRTDRNILVYALPVGEAPPPNATYITLDQFESWFNPNASFHWNPPKNAKTTTTPTVSFTPEAATAPPSTDDNFELPDDPMLARHSSVAYSPRWVANEAWGIGNVKGRCRDQLIVDGYQNWEQVFNDLKDLKKAHELCMKYRLGVYLGRSEQVGKPMWLFKPYSDFYDPTIHGYSLSGVSYLTWDDLVEALRYSGYSDQYIKEAIMRGPLRACGYAWQPWKATVPPHREYRTNIPSYLFPSSYAYEQAWLNKFYYYPVHDPTWILRESHVDIFSYGNPSVAYFTDNKFGYQVMRGNRELPLILHYKVAEKLTIEELDAIGNSYLFFTLEGSSELMRGVRSKLVNIRPKTGKWIEYYSKLKKQYPSLSDEQIGFAAEVYSTAATIKDLQAQLEKREPIWAKRYPINRLRPLPWHEKLEDLGLDLDDIHPSPIMILYKRFMNGDPSTVKAASALPMSEEETKQFKTSLRDEFARELAAYVKRHKDYFSEWDLEYYCNWLDAAGFKAQADEIRRSSTQPSPFPKLGSLTPIRLDLLQVKIDRTALLGQINITLTTLRQLKDLRNMDLRAYFKTNAKEVRQVGEQWLQTIRNPEVALALLSREDAKGYGIGTYPLTENLAIDNLLIATFAIGFVLVIWPTKSESCRTIKPQTVKKKNEKRRSAYSS